MGINTGPIVDSTRKLYERKLTKLLNRGKEAAYSTDEDAAPETPVIEDQVEEKPKRPVRTKKATKKVEEQATDTYSADEDNNEVQQVRKSRRIKAKKETADEKTAESENEEPVENGTSEATSDETEAPVEAEAAVDEAGTVEDAEETPSATADEAATPSTDNTASKTRVNTMLFFFLMLVACYLVYSESETIIAKTNELTTFVVDKYTTLYYSLLPEIETTTESVDDTPPPSDELQNTHKTFKNQPFYRCLLN